MLLYLTSCVGWDIRYPSHARMWIAPMQTTVGERKLQEYQHSMGDWSRFIQETSDQYGVDMRVLTDPYREEQRKYFLQARDLEIGFFNLLFFLEIPNNQYCNGYHSSELPFCCAEGVWA